MLNEYLFQYNVPAHNDVMDQTNLYLNMKAIMLPMCPGINPVVSIVFLENHAVSLQRLLSIDQVVRDCERIAIEHFKSEGQQDLNIITLPINHINQLIPAVLS